MGVDRKIYIGAYFEATTRLSESAEKINTCSNKDCPAYKAETSKKFCGNCGAVVMIRNRPKNSPAVHWGEVHHRLDDSLFCVSAWGVPERGPNSTIVHRYISNKGNVASRLDFDLDGSPGAFAMHDSVREGHMASLENAHRADAAMLREMYGRDNVTTKWGVLYMVW